MPVAIEQHAEFITNTIAHMRARGAARIEPQPEVMETWGEQVAAKGYEGFASFA